MQTFYAIEYRSMRTAIHGLFVYSDEQIAEEVCSALFQLEDIDLSDDSDYPVNDILRVDDMADDQFAYDEIDYRDIEWDDKRNDHIYRDPFNDDIEFVIMNPNMIAFDIYGI